MNILAIKGTVKLGLKSLWMHKLRSTLTTLGIVFGVCSVIAMLAIGEGASREAQAAIARLGSTNLIIETVQPQQTQTSTEQTVNRYGLTYDDAESIRNTFAHLEVTVPIREIPSQARYLTRKTAVKVIGTVPWYNEVAPVRLLRGRFLSSTDLHRNLSVCVIDEQLVDKLFAFEDPIGKLLKIADSVYEVVGVSAESMGDTLTAGTQKGIAAALSSGVAGNVYMPLTTAKTRFSEMTGSFGGNTRNMEIVELQKIIVKVNSNEEVLPTHALLDGLLKRIHNNKQDYHIEVPLELLEEAARQTRIFSIVLGSIAAISLLVGGIGIMNIMLATVSERTREIGIRRALGAKKTDIIFQFLAETLLLTLAGGLLGVLLGSVIPYVVTKFSDVETVITGLSLILAFGISALIGVTFGMYPAWHAANMNPIESLRHE